MEDAIEFVVGTAALLLFVGLIVMCSLSLLHEYLSPSIPALGYWSSVVVGLALRALVKVCG